MGRDGLFGRAELGSLFLFIVERGGGAHRDTHRFGGGHGDDGLGPVLASMAETGSIREGEVI